MILNYLTSVWRNVTRNKTFTALNLLGLAIGMTAFILIGQYVLYELTYDTFWRDSERVYRVQLDRYDKGELSTRWASGCVGIGPDLKANFPEVNSYVRMNKSNAMLSYGDAFFREENIYYTSRDFFKVMGLSLAEGVDSTALDGPNKIVLSRSLARKYFGNEPALGKTMRNNGRVEYLVTGIYEDLPAHSHMTIDAMLSFATYAKLVGREEAELTQWQWDGFLTYIRLNEHANVNELAAKMPEYIQRREGEELKQYNAGMVFHFMPITDIHLDSDFIGEFKPNGSRDTTYFLLVVAVLIIVIAWINYVNLSTAKSIERAREVGVRKVMGGFRWQLVQQFLTESLLLNVVALSAALAAAFTLTPWFGNLAGTDMEYILFKQPLFWAGLLAFALAGALVSGLYPAFVLSAFRPVEVLKGRFKNTNSGVAFRKGMVVLQFMASLTLMVGTFTVFQQLNYMRSRKLGVNISQTVVVRSPNVTDSTYVSKFEVLKERLKGFSEVEAVCASTAIPGSSPDWNAGGIRRLSQRQEESNQYRVIMMDHDFIPSYGLEVVAGRAFSGETVNEQASVMLNEAATKLMGFERPELAVDDQINFWGDTFRIVGVVKNYNQESIKKAYEPLVFRYNQAPGGYYSIRFNTAQVQQSMARFEETWKDVFAGNPFNYFFLDEHYNLQYKADQQFGKVFALFAGLAIFIACLGLFGLSSLTALQRTKEIGVRKVLGASVGSILTLISKDYLWLMLISIAAAIPVSWWLMHNWLQDFASRIDLEWWIFAVPGMVLICIALFTVGAHTLRAAQTNPAKSLRYE